MTKVVILTIAPSPYQRDLFKALSKEKDIAIKVYYCEGDIPDHPWERDEFETFEHILPNFRIQLGNFNFIWNFSIPDLKDTDLVILNGYNTSAAQWFLHFQAKRYPFIFWSEKIRPSTKKIRKLLQRTLGQRLKIAMAIAAIGKSAHRDFLKRFPETSIHEIPYTCNLDPFRSKIPHRRPRSPIRLLFCGQMIYRKGVDLLLEAFDKLILEGYKIELLLVGRQAELPEMVRRLTLAPETLSSIQNLGFKQPDELPLIFSEADLFILPSRYDGWGVVLNQALGAGLPVFCSDHVGASEDLVKPGINGEVFQANQTSALVSALKPYLNDPEKIIKASKRSLELSYNFDSEAGTRLWKKLILN